MRFMRLAKPIIGVAGTALGLLALARFSAWELPAFPPAEAMLRLSWTAHPERIEVCRAVSAEEQAQRPEHMRQRMDCEGRTATYSLRVEVDSQLVGEFLVRGGGFRHDRPIFMLREFAVPPGRRQVHISFVRRDSTARDTVPDESRQAEPADTGLFAGRAQREVFERTRRTEAAIPPRLILDTAVTFAQDHVALVTFDPDRKAFELITETPADQESRDREPTARSRPR